MVGTEMVAGLVSVYLWEIRGACGSKDQGHMQ